MLGRVFLLCCTLIGISAVAVPLSMEMESGDELQLLTDVGKNISLPCLPNNFAGEEPSVYWVREGARSSGERVMDDGSLMLVNLTISDTHLYTCKTVDDLVIRKVHLFVRGPPPAPTDVAVHPSSVVAVLSWHLNLDSKWEEKMAVSTRLHLQYRILDSGNEWQILPYKLPPTQRQVNIYQLKPNTTYEFELWTQNKFGQSSIVWEKATTLHNYEEIDIARHMLQTSPGFSARIWLSATIAIMVVVNISGSVLLFFYSRERGRNVSSNLTDSEQIELVPNIIENPSYYNDSLLSSVSDTEPLVQSRSFLSTSVMV